MEIKVKVNFDIDKLDVNEVKRIGFINASQEIIRRAREKAPYDTGTLKKSIGAEPLNITKSTNQVRVWPRKVVYAVRREFENKKNPWRKFYMKRTYDEAEAVVKEQFTKAVEIVARKMLNR